MDPRTVALEIWQAGVAAVDGFTATQRALIGADRPDQIIAVGKAAGAMARAALDRFADCPTLVVTKDGHGKQLPPHTVLIEASHPVPDARSLLAGQKVQDCLRHMPASSHLLLLVSGGASALVEDLEPGATLEDLRALNNRLLADGLDIAAMNQQRRTLSRIKGVGLVSGFKGANIEVLAISDVEGDDIAVIGSGIGANAPTPHPGYTAQIIASNAIARAAAAETSPLPVLGNEEIMYGDVSVLARKIGAQLRDMPAGVLIFGGEPTVVLPPSPGNGGRNQALALGLAREIAGQKDLSIVVAGTDGSDGPTQAAGGIIDGCTWSAEGQDALDRADSGSYLKTRDALLITGPTGTNVMDLLVAVRGN